MCLVMNDPLIFLFPLAITLHNIEEAIWLPKWSGHAARFHRPVGAFEFRFAVLAVTLLAYAATLAFWLCPGTDIFRWALYGFTGAMMLNSLFPHLAATIVLKRYAPGTATGLLLNIPAGVIIIREAMHAGAITWPELALSIAGTAGVILPLLPLLFMIGRRLEKTIRRKTTRG